MASCASTREDVMLSQTKSFPSAVVVYTYQLHRGFRTQRPNIAKGLDARRHPSNWIDAQTLSATACSRLVTKLWSTVLHKGTVNSRRALKRTRKITEARSRNLHSIIQLPAISHSRNIPTRIRSIQAIPRFLCTFLNPLARLINGE